MCGRFTAIFVPRDKDSLESSERLLRSRPASIAPSPMDGLFLLPKMSVDKSRLSPAHLH